MTIEDAAQIPMIEDVFATAPRLHQIADGIGRAQRWQRRNPAIAGQMLSNAILDLREAMRDLDNALQEASCEVVEK